MGSLTLCSLDPLFTTHVCRLLRTVSTSRDKGASRQGMHIMVLVSVVCGGGVEGGWRL